MSMGVELYLRLDEPLSQTAVSSLRDRFVVGVGLDPVDDFGTRRPLRYEDDPSFLPDPAAHWYDANLFNDYYGPGYERGNLPQIVRCAEWLEAAVPGGRVWYGNDCSDESIQPFGPPERAEAMAYYDRVGHEPYERRMREAQARPLPPLRRGIVSRLIAWLLRQPRR